jgi:hypothetical protein
MKKILFILIGFTLLFISCDKSSNLLPEPKGDNSKTTRRDYRVTVEQAINEVNSLLNIIDGNNTGNGTMATMSAKQHRTVKDVNVITTKSNDNGLMLMSAGANSNSTIDTLYYVINFENEQGFAFASADIRFEPVLCITENGNYYDGDSIDNPGFAIFMAGLEIYIDPNLRPIHCPECSILDTSGTDIPSVPYIGLWETDTYVPKKITVKWGQGFPFNYYTPIISGKKAPAGCVATAIAQIFSYYQYPTNHSSFNYDWVKIFRSVMGLYVDDFENIGHLFYHDIGLGVNMIYGANGSASSDSYAQYYLFHRGGYTCSSVLNYSTTTIKSALDQNKLVYIGGAYYSNNSSGHAWAIDGYLNQKRTIIEDGQSYYEYRTLVHCNWGWNGSGNGYFVSGAFAIRIIEDESDSPYYDLSDDDTPVTGYNYGNKIITIYH